MATRRTADKPKARKPTAAAPKAAKKPTAAAPKAAKKPAAPASTAKAISRLPDFRLTDQNGEPVTRKDLLGSPVVLYFYPKDDTPGCTTEACSFRDEGAAFRKLGLRVVGVSPDSERSHQRFAEKYGLDFTLLSDPDKTLAKAFDVWQLKKNYGKEYMGIVRSTFLLDAAGRVVESWRGVKVKGHTDAVLERARKLVASRQPG